MSDTSGPEKGRHPRGKGQEPGLSRDQVQALLEAAEWTFAKTMPDNPHHYTVKKKWADPEEFLECVRFIRHHGVVRQWPRPPAKGRPYLELELGGFKYWTMEIPGYPSDRGTVLINRKPLGVDDDGPAA